MCSKRNTQIRNTNKVHVFDFSRELLSKILVNKGWKSKRNYLSERVSILYNYCKRSNIEPIMSTCFASYSINENKYTVIDECRM